MLNAKIYIYIYIYLLPTQVLTTRTEELTVATCLMQSSSDELRTPVYDSVNVNKMKN